MIARAITARAAIAASARLGTARLAAATAPARTAPACGFGFLTRHHLPRRARRDRDGHAQHFLDVLQFAHLVGGAKGDGRPVAPGARGAPDPVHVIVRHVRQFEVIDVFHIGNIEATRGHIRGHQHLGVTVAERPQRAIALTLALVAMDRGDGIARLLQPLRQLVGAMLGAAKDQRQFVAMLVEEFDQQIGLGGLGDEMHLLRDLVGGLARRADLHAAGIFQIA